MVLWVRRGGVPYLAGLHHGGQEAHVELRPGGADVVLAPHQLDVLSAGQVGPKRHWAWGETTHSQ